MSINQDGVGGCMLIHDCFCTWYIHALLIESCLYVYIIGNSDTWTILRHLFRHYKSWTGKEEYHGVHKWCFVHVVNIHMFTSLCLQISFFKTHNLCTVFLVWVVFLGGGGVAPKYPKIYCLTVLVWCIRSPPGGELSVAPTRHRVTCGSKPGVGGIFSCFCPFLFMLLVLRF